VLRETRYRLTIAAGASLERTDADELVAPHGMRTIIGDRLWKLIEIRSTAAFIDYCPAHSLEEYLWTLKERSVW
jgi:hypothetical protein